MRLKEIRKFARKMDKAKQKIKKNRSQERAKRMKPIDVGKYSTKLQQQHIEEERARKILAESKERERFERFNKRTQYSQIIASTMKPQVSKKKQEEIEQLIKRAHHKGRKVRDSKLTGSKSYCRSGPEDSQATGNMSSDNTKPSKPTKKIAKRQNSRAIKLPESSQISQQDSKSSKNRNSKNVDYLSQLRRKRERLEQSGRTSLHPHF